MNPQVGFAIIFLNVCLFLVFALLFPTQWEEETRVQKWLIKNGLESLVNLKGTSNLKSLEDWANADISALGKAEPAVDVATLLKLADSRSHLQLWLWLEKETLTEYYQPLQDSGFSTLWALSSLPIDDVDLVIPEGGNQDKFKHGLLTLKKKFCPPHRKVSQAKESGIVLLLYQIKEVVSVLILSVLAIGIVGLFVGPYLFGVFYMLKLFITSCQKFLLDEYKNLMGLYLDPTQCLVEWNHSDYAKVGSASVVTIKLVKKNSAYYQLTTSTLFNCHIFCASKNIELPYIMEPELGSLQGHSSLQISFTAKVSGQYFIIFKVNDILISEITRTYLPGPLDPKKTEILERTLSLVVTQGIYSAMKIVPRDRFGNRTTINEKVVDIDIRKNSDDGEQVVHELVVYKNDIGMYELQLKLDQEGHYVGTLKYKSVRVGPSHFSIITLSADKMATLKDNVQRKNLNVGYEAEYVNKKRRVCCYIFPLRLHIPLLGYTCRVSPSTKFIFHSEPMMFTLDDGFQEPVTLISPHREILGATFHQFVLENIGGSEKFEHKRNFFYNKLREHYPHHIMRRIKRVTVNRSNLLESAITATEDFTPFDWCQRFWVEFEDEIGADFGGLSREFFELMCTQLFGPSTKLFVRFSDENHQTLVHPNQSRNLPSSFTLQYFKFAGKIVGKCLYENSMGNTLLVKAKFTRSFLAQLIGLRVNYKYFESDDPDLYTSKIKYILENDITDLDLGLVFAEEEFNSCGGPPTEIALVKDGEKKEVTEQNKSQYLNALATYRLTTRVDEEIREFVKGLNEIVPDYLLSIFNENELELLMCGIDKVSHEDLKNHATIRASSTWFERVLSWFWIIISDFTQEEMAKLLQFVTGSSQLPHGGFKELNPQFTITSAPTLDRLPTAHTCFNQLCLPDYSTCEQFQASLMTAINEGAEGFGIV